MQNPFQVSFKGMEPNKAVESEVRAWVTKLSSLIDAARMMSGRMVIESAEQNGSQRHHGPRYHAYMELTTLDAAVIVERDQVGNDAHEDVFVAVRNAFRLLRRQLVAVRARQQETNPDRDGNADSDAVVVVDPPVNGAG
jgi:hypothetical protein